MVHPENNLKHMEQFDSREEALDHARERAKEAESDVLIHNDEGEIVERIQYSDIAASEDAQYYDET